MEDSQIVNYAALYDHFRREKQYLANVSPATISGYGWAWKAFERTFISATAPITKATIISRIAEMRDKGMTPVTINTYLRSINTFFHWLHEERHCSERLKIPRLKEDQKIIQTFSGAQIRALVSFKPQTKGERMVHVIACLILDSGARIDEVLSLERQDVDFDNLLLKIRNAKGGKERVVPISLQLRKLLFRFMQHDKPEAGSHLFFAGLGEKIHQRNALREFKTLCKRIHITGPRCSFHTLRHSFGKAYIRLGGDVFRLQRILGHAKLEMTRKYVNLETSDLQGCHQSFSLLAKTR